MVDYFTDSRNLHIRHSIRLNQSLVDEMLSRNNGFGATRYFVARHIDLDDAVFADSDVVLVADTVSATAPGRVQIKLTHSTTARDGVVTNSGQVEPPIAVEGDPPRPGAPGHELTILCRSFIAGQGESYGQRGGKGLRGPYETRTYCEQNFNPIPELDPCADVPLDELLEMVGGRGGRGLPGAVGGPGGTIRVLCLENHSGGTGGFVGVGGLGGIGGDGGRGGPNGRGLTGVNPHGPDGPRGAQPDRPPSVTHPIQVVGEAALQAEIGKLSTAIKVGFELLEHHRIAELWAEFRRRQAGDCVRRREYAGALEHRTAANRLVPPTPADLDLAEQIRSNATQFSVERDLDLPADVPLFNDPIEKDPLRMWSRLSTAIAGIGAPAGTPPRLLDPTFMQQVSQELAGVRARLLAEGEANAHETPARERRDLARASRKAAHLTRSALKPRLDKLIDDAPAGFAITVPGVGPALDKTRLKLLVTSVAGLAPTIGSDEGSVDAISPSQDVATLLPGDVTLLVHSTTRTAGAKGVFPADAAELRAHAMTLIDEVSTPGAWTAVRTANTTGKAVDLRTLAAQLRGALRPPGAPPLTDPARLDIVNGLIELTEAMHAWRLADLRLEQALAAHRLAQSAAAAIARDAAGDTGAGDPAGRPSVAADPPDPPRTAPLAGIVEPFLRRARAVSDLVEWRWHRLERAFDLYTLGISPLPIDRAAHAALFDPELEAVLAGDLKGQLTGGEAADAARSIATALDRISRAFVLPAYQAYENRGQPTQSSETAEPFPARRVFCLHAAADPTEGCPVASPHVFAALRNEEQAACWLDVDLSDVQGPHREAKLRGAFIRITYDLDAELGALPEQLYQVELRHSGHGRQRQLGSGVEHASVALPQPMKIDMKQVSEDGSSMPYWEGEITVDAPDQPNQPAPSPGAVFPAYGRGVAAGYRLDIAQDFNRAAPQRMTRLEVHINYQARQPPGTANLRSVTLTTALRVGATASALVRLTAPAPAPGVVVKLTSSDPSALAVPGQVLVPAGSVSVTAPVQVLKATGGVPPTLTAATADGVTRRALAPVSKKEPLVARSAVLSILDGATFAVAVGRFPTGGPRPGPTVLVSRTAPFFPEEPVGEGQFNAVHALRPDLTELTQREIGVWPRSIALDEKRRRVYVLHGPTVSALDGGTLATVATRSIGINASMVAVDPAADLVYVTRYSEGTVHVLRGADLSVVQIFGDKPSLRGCLGIAVHPDGGRVYVARNYRLAEPTATAVTSIVRRPDGSHVIDRDAPFAPVGLQPHAVAVDGPAGLVFVACQGGGGVHPTLLTLDAVTLGTVSSVAVPGPGMSVAARPGTGTAYLACYSGLVLVDGRAGSIALTVKAGTHPQGVAVDPVTGTAYLTDRSDRTVTRIETPAAVTTRPWR